MNKSVLRTFAINARKELLERVELQARKIGITKNKIEDAYFESSDAVFINGKQLTDVERKQRNKLINRINEIGFDQVMEETAYTWFNRFVALRFMEVNDYLPTKVRVLSSETEGSTEPDMIREALSFDLPIDKEYVYDLKMDNNTEELFKYLIKLHCNDLNRYMPFMFEAIEDYMAILFPEGLLGTDSFVQEMIDTEKLPEENWKSIEVIGWLYQFYISEEKDRVFKAKKKYKPEEIPFATQLFTPDWIVQYMVQNSLGRYWVEAHPEHYGLTDDWQFFIEHEEENFQEKIAPYVNKELNVEDIKCFDPAMGSGHILVYMFDVLYEIYVKCGYMEREIPILIIENNLYGLDIDNRAYQLASFSVVMKALEYNRRFLRTIERHGLSLNLASIQETNGLTDADVTYLAGEEKGETFDEVKEFIEQFKDAKSIGSLLKLDNLDVKYLKSRLEEIQNAPAEELFSDDKREQILDLLPKLIKQTQIMGQHYDILSTNPPYMSSRSMNEELSGYLRENYPDSKADLFAAFMEVDQYLKQNGFYAAINQHSWMFLSSYEKLRKNLIENKFIDTMLHLGSRAFEEIGGEVVQSTAFVWRNVSIPNVGGVYLRLLKHNTSMKKRESVIKAIHNPTVSYRYIFKQCNFIKVTGRPIAYWVNEKIGNIFEKFRTLAEYSEPKQGMTTSDNKRFLRVWSEVNINDVGFNLNNRKEAKNSNYKWFPYNKGGEYRKWYGNNVYIVNYKNDGQELEEFHQELNKTSSGGRLKNRDYYFREGITWSFIGTSRFGIRYSPRGFIFDVAGSSLFPENKNIKYLLAFLSSNISYTFLKILNPTMNFQVENIKRLPIIMDQNAKGIIDQLTNENVRLSKKDWDSFEDSWDFKKHPLLKFISEKIESSFSQWSQFTESSFHQLKDNEKELNLIFIDIYGLQDEITADVDDEDVTIRKADLERDIRSFVSYAVGCTFGRYSLDEEGLIYAGSEFDPSRYQTFPADENNILPILPGAYFEDDIVTRFINFVKVTYGEDTLEENLNFVADAIGRRKNETAREALRRYFLNNFYKDHVQTYKKRPIYWLFTSGKEKAFNCLIYMHRYDKTTLSRIRTDYLHDVQVRYESEKKDLLSTIEDEGNATAKEIRDAKKELTSVEKKIEELKAYDEKLHHLADMQIEIDLDDGVKVNYEKFKGLVAKI